MKITKRQLRRIIKEELSRALKEQGASPPRWSTGGEDPWQPTSTRWTGMPSRGYGDTDLYADPNPPPVETSIHQDFADLQMGMRNPYTPWEMLSGGGRQRRLEAALTNNPGLEERLRKAANDIRAPGARSHGDLKAIGNAFFEELSAAIEKEYA